jgi:hypothetical protein
LTPRHRALYDPPPQTAQLGQDTPIDLLP